METALRRLGRLDPNERVRRYISNQQAQTYQPLQHDFGCICFQCERQQVLGLRRSRRSEPVLACRSVVQAQTPLSIHARRRHDPGSGYPNRTPHRRRPMNDNAMRGESKLGRAAHLRPGRVTLGQIDTTMAAAETLLHLEHRDDPPLRPSVTPSNPSVDENHDFDAQAFAEGPSAHTSDKETSWDSDEHSLHSNLVHHQRVLMKQTRSDPSQPLQAEWHQASEAVPTAQMPQNGTTTEAATCRNGASHLFDDFYKRNPAALANGWLALGHHRDLPAWAQRSGPSPGLDNLVQALIQPHQPQLVGLMPKFKSKRKRYRSG